LGIKPALIDVLSMQTGRGLLFLALLTGWNGPATATERQIVPGHLPLAAVRAHPIERLPATNRLDLAIGLPLRDPAALLELLGQLYQPGGTNFHRFLTANQFTERFGPGATDYQAVIQFAKENGLTITGIHPNRMLLDVRGRVDDLEKALHLTFQVYAHPQEARTFFAPDQEPSPAIGTRVLHISGLDNYTLPHPRNLRPSATAPATAARPMAGSGPTGTFLGNDFRTAYLPGTTLTGAGQIAGLFELDGYYASDIAAYQSLAGLPIVPLQNVLIDGFSGNQTGRRPGSGNEEVALDIEMLASMAPGLSRIVVYEGPPTSTTANINDILNRMATDNQARQLSCSWGFDIDATTEQIFQQYAAQGQSFFLASGDNGAFSGPVLQPSDNPYITVVGGTTLTTDGSGAWVSEDAWSNSGGGISTIIPIPDWQQGIDMTANQGSTTMRNLPDVAMVAENVWAISDRGRSSAFAGTSIAAPLWAAFTALVNEQAAALGQPPVGFLNPALYTIGKGSSLTNCFHDITTGNNTSSSSPELFSAVPGYDLCTGWGTPGGTNLINALLGPSLDPLRITPSLGFVTSRKTIGPFAITSQTYSLTNSGNAPLRWSASTAAPWLGVSPTSGTLNPGDPAAEVLVSLNTTATNTVLGDFSDVVEFTDLASGVSQSRPFSMLVGNGGFETGDFTDWTLAAKATDNFVDSIDATALDGGSSIPGVDDSLFVYSGIYGAFLGQTASIGTLSKTLPTVPGQQYALSFWLDNPASGTPNEFHALWNGSSVFDLANADQFTWTNLQYTVTASATSTVLQFRFRNDQAAFGLDNISAQPSPSPTLQLLSNANGTVTFGWTGVAGVTYQVQYATDLNAANWTALGNPLTGTGPLSESDAIAPSGQRFYRLLLSP
jgi:hypothetical protein